MQANTLSKTVLLAAILAGFALSPLLLYFLPITSIHGDATSLAGSVFALQKPKVNLEIPVRIKIPIIKVNATLDSVGLTPDGAVGVPKDPTHAAWFNKGPFPGQVGSSVITGHIGPWGGGKKPTFDNVKKLKKGDTLSVTNGKGVISTFIVNKVATYGEHDDVPDAFFSRDGKAHLNLITCAGTWNRATKSYSKRLVVFTDKVEPKKSSLW